jgi:hypothetical protein
MPVSVWTSTLKRTIQTAELLPFPKLRWKVRARARLPLPRPALKKCTCFLHSADSCPALQFALHVRVGSCSGSGGSSHS